MSTAQEREYRTLKEKVEVLNGDRGDAARPERAVRLKELDAIKAQIEAGGEGGGGGEIPTKLSELQNDTGFIDQGAADAAATEAVSAHVAENDPHPQYAMKDDVATTAQGDLADSAVQPGDLAAVATSGQYGDLSGKPTLGTASASDADDFATAAQGTRADSAVQPGELSAVATSGAYADLDGLPSLGTAAAADVDDFATSAQGLLADTALQPGAEHNTALSGLQGGGAGEHYHATAAQNAALAALAISGYIDGLQMVWNSVNSVSFTSGTAAIPSLGALIRFPSSITKSGLSLAASTFYHAYGFSNSGTPDVEITTTAPSSPYLGSARTKTGDTSRRYLGSFLTDTSGFIHQFIQAGSLVLYPRGGAGGGSIFRVLSAKITAAEQAVSLSGVIPITASGVFARFFFNRSIGDNAMNFGPTSGLPKLNNVTSPGVAFFTVPLTPVQALYIILNNDVTDGNGAAYIDVNGYTYER